MDTFESAHMHRRTDGFIDTERYCMEARRLRSAAARGLLAAQVGQAQHQAKCPGGDVPVAANAGQGRC